MRRIKKTVQDDSELPPFQRLVNRARRGDGEASAELKVTLDKHPGIWREVGDLATMAREVAIKALANGDPLLEESVQRKADELERELAGESASPLLRLAVQRFVATWLQLQHADAAAAKASTESLPLAKFWAQRQDQAGRRYERALKTLVRLLKADNREQVSNTTSDDTTGKLDPADVLLRVAGGA